MSPLPNPAGLFNQGLRENLFCIPVLGEPTEQSALLFGFPSMGGLRAKNIRSYSEKPLSRPNRFTCIIHTDSETQSLSCSCWDRGLECGLCRMQPGDPGLEEQGVTKASATSLSVVLMGPPCCSVYL